MEYCENALHEAIITGDVSSVEDFLKRGLNPDHVFCSKETDPSDIDRLGNTLLEEAVRAEKTEVVRLLARHGCDPNVKYLVQVSRFSYTFEPYVKQDRLKLTCLYSCLVKRRVAMVRELVAAGMDVNIHDDRGCTALWHAVDLRDYEMARAITSSRRGCDVNIADVTMLRPLHVAALHGDVRLASLLLQHGAAVDAVQFRGSTPLILACRAASFQTARLLLVNGADPNHVGLNGHMPLTAALDSCTERTLPDLLIQAGAIVDSSTLRKCRRENLPLLYRCPEMLELLTEVARTPHELKLQCVLTIRRILMSTRQGRVSAGPNASGVPACEEQFVLKVQRLPVPRVVQEFIQLSNL